jgi:hypothetical protein
MEETFRILLFSNPINVKNQDAMRERDMFKVI